MHLLRLSSLLGAATLLTSLAIASPAAATTVTCGSVLTQSTTLTADLHCSGAALGIGADGVTLDLGGHTISGDGTGFGVDANAVLTRITGTTIRNGTISGFTTGIAMDDNTDTTITGIRLTDDAVGQHGMFRGALVSFIGSVGIHVTNTTIRGTGPAVFVQGGDITMDRSAVSGGGSVSDLGGGMTLTHDVFTDAPVNTDESGGLTLSFSVLTRSPVNAGVFDNAFTTIEHDVITGSGVAVLISGPTTDYTVSGNLFAGNTVGVEVASPLLFVSTTKITGNAFVGNGAAGVLVETTGTSTTPLAISGNTFVGNGFRSGGLTDGTGHPVMDGLHVDSAPGSDIVVSGNATRFNAAFGIWAQPGTVVDGGGNTSVGNPSGCSGVVCS